MTKPVKRYDAPKLRVYDAKAQGFCVVEYADYASLEQEYAELVERYGKLQTGEGHITHRVIAERDAALKQVEGLLDLLADWSSHFTGPKVIGGPLSSLRERTDAALLNGGRS